MQGRAQPETRTACDARPFGARFLLDVHLPFPAKTNPDAGTSCHRQLMGQHNELGVGEVGGSH